MQEPPGHAHVPQFSGSFDDGNVFRVEDVEGFDGFEKTRLALLRLADNVHDTEATRILLQEHRVLFAAALQKWFGPDYSERIMLDLVNHLALRARYYDPAVNPANWLDSCLDLECRRLLREMKNH